MFVFQHFVFFFCLVLCFVFVCSLGLFAALVVGQLKHGLFYILDGLELALLVVCDKPHFGIHLAVGPNPGTPVNIPKAFKHLNLGRVIIPKKVP